MFSLNKQIHSSLLPDFACLRNIIFREELQLSIESVISSILIPVKSIQNTFNPADVAHFHSKLDD